MSELLSLPAGDLEGGFVYAPREVFDGIGLRPAEEQQELDDRLAALEEDTIAVQTNEHAVAAQRIADAEAAAGGLKVSSLIPNWCSIADTERVLLHVHGSGFTETTQIWWHDHLETTVFVSEGELTTWILPWLFYNPDNILVGVQDAGVDGDQKLYFGLLP